MNEELGGVVLLKSAEVDILEDGSLALPQSVLQNLDFTVCAIHDGFDLSRDTQTERVIRAMDNPHFHLLAHPTGRLINGRDPCELDIERVMEAALERGCFLELNARPDRLDLNDVHCKMAKEIGLKVAIASDAHSAAELEFLRFGVDQARRSWLEREDILNTRRWKELEKLLKRR